MMSTKNIIKYGLLWGLLIWAMVVRGQQVEILHEGKIRYGCRNSISLFGIR
ncbi:hypothetical protein [Butyricimonas faecihominis]|uniref:hypothetical protein n=1 Tax=Butyricimonas faecihominis TaxID=1472416 RepID=UPI002954CAC3|nr:hypothetical protein [Butyricimonas faecihominis]